MSPKAGWYSSCGTAGRLSAQARTRVPRVAWTFSVWIPIRIGSRDQRWARTLAGTSKLISECTTGTSLSWKNHGPRKKIESHATSKR